jgi:hypothetical protein
MFQWAKFSDNIPSMVTVFFMYTYKKKHGIKNINKTRSKTMELETTRSERQHWRANWQRDHLSVSLFSSPLLPYS